MDHSLYVIDYKSILVFYREQMHKITITSHCNSSAIEELQKKKKKKKKKKTLSYMFSDKI